MSWNPDALESLDDEALVLLARADSVPAVHILIMRHNGWLRRQMAKLARVFQLGTPDIEELQQETFFLHLKAIRYYQDSPLPRGPYRQFLRWFLRYRGRNLIRALSRNRRRDARKLLALKVGDSVASVRRKCVKDDPLRVVTTRETTAALEAVANVLQGDELKLWNLLQDGQQVPELAAAFRISERTVRRRRLALFAKARALLHDSSWSFGSAG
jgi:hypothetical protein